MEGRSLEERVRFEAMAYLNGVLARTGGVVRHDDVADFTFEGTRIRLMDKGRGIRKPALLEAALTFSTAPAPRPDARPYDDSPGPDGFQRYKWQGTDPDQWNNRGMRRAMVDRLPLIWFQGVTQGLYLPVFPVYLVGEEPDLHQFVVALDDLQAARWDMGGVVDDTQRRYVENVTRQRLHQPLFRQRVLAAYERRCAMCRLRHIELLDAAHIRSDSDGGEPVVTNGLAMCKIHHAGYDADMIGVDPDYRIHVRPDLLGEKDGPTLRHAIQGLHHSTLTVPSKRSAQPDRALLDVRFERFRQAS